MRARDTRKTINSLIFYAFPSSFASFNASCIELNAFFLWFNIFLFFLPSLTLFLSVSLSHVRIDDCLWQSHPIPFLAPLCDISSCSKQHVCSCRNFFSFFINFFFYFVVLAKNCKQTASNYSIQMWHECFAIKRDEKERWSEKKEDEVKWEINVYLLNRWSLPLLYFSGLNFLLFDVWNISSDFTQIFNLILIFLYLLNKVQ